MTQAILEIGGMLIGALAIGIFFTNQYWKSKSGSTAQNVESLAQENERLKSKEKDLEQKLADQKALKKPEAKPVEVQSDNGNSEELEAELKDLGKDLKEQKKKAKELRATVKALKIDLEIKDEQLGEKERELEEVTQHFKTHNISYYKQIDGKRYKAAIILEADEAVAGVGDGRISMADAEKIFSTISDGHLYTQVEKDTMHYIRENYNWTPEADELFRRKVRSWAAKGHQLD